MKQVLHCVAGLSKLSGGPSACVPALAGAVANHRWETHLAYVASQLDVELAGRRFDAMPFGASRPMSLSSSRELKSFLLSGRHYDIYHAHGLWQSPSNYAVRAAHRRGVASVLSVHGMLEPWALRRSRLKKWIAGVLFQNRSLRDCTCFHATAEAECESIRQFGLRAPVAVVSNGVYLPAIEAATGSGRPYILFLGRVHPHKNVDVLLDAWDSIRPSTDWRLLVAGPLVGSYGQQIRARADDIGDSVALLGPVWEEQKKTELLRDAQALVLPSKSENFGMVVVEALACSTPVIACKTTPWRELEERDCGWWIDVGVEPLRRALQSAMELSDAERASMGARGRQLVEERYTWDRIGAQMVEVYEWLLGGGSPPECVVM